MIGWRGIGRPFGWNRSSWGRAGTGLAALVLAVVSGAAVRPGSAGASGPCSPVVNPVVCENSKDGSPPVQWEVSGAGDPDLQGFATDISVDAGHQIDFKIKSSSPSYEIDIYRLGWYDGDGARKIDSVSPSAPLPQEQPDCVSNTTTGIYDCGTWAVSASWQVPATAVSGVYIARVYKPGVDGGSHIPFVVRDDASHSTVFFQTSDPTWQAYNNYGGSDFYGGGANGRAYKLSYNRPFATRGDNAGRDYLFSNEYPMIRFLERNGYDVSYTTGVDSDRRGELIRNHGVFLSVGHDEYWSGAQRANVEAARDAGVDLAFFSGNEVYWRTRWESGVDGGGAPYRTLVSYKETWAGNKIDPAQEWTGTWRDPRFSSAADGGGRPENELTGTAYMANHDDLPITVPAAQGKYRIWRNTDAATQTSGSLALAPHTVGYESDEDIDNGFRPAGLVRMSTTVGETPQYLRDFGNVVTPGTTTHSITLHRAPSGALVFSAGTIQWAWGLDSHHDAADDTEPADRTMQQATVNILADMGAQPETLMLTLAPAAASTDAQAPAATITAPPSGATAANDGQVTLQGTATDAGGGRVAGVEVSTDGGTTWHPATGTTSWSYTFRASGLGHQDLLARATDDSANRGAATSPRRLALTGPNTLFGNAVPDTPADSDGTGVELGVKLRPSAGGYITGIRFYKGAGNTGAHTGSLWSAAGERIATGDFENESASGWQKLTFASPVEVIAGTAYVASYWAPNGHYAADPWQFNYRDWLSGPIAAARATPGAGNGLFRYGGGFPDSGANGMNYYVDVLFASAEDLPPTVTVMSPGDGATSVAVSAHPTATFNKAIDPASLHFTLTDSHGATLAGTSAYDATQQVATLTPAADLATNQTYTVSVRADDLRGNTMSEPAEWSFTTGVGSAVRTLFGQDATPAVPATGDGNAVELGVRFQPSVYGKVVGLRYYQGAGNTGTHTGTLWSAGGTELARVVFPGSTAVGWRTAMFSTPITANAGTTYVVSYHAPAGHYAASSNFFASAWTNGPLSAPGGANGLFRYSATPAFPDGSWESTNYWVDPLFEADATQPAATASFFGPQDAPAVANWDDGAAVEVGIRFTTDSPGLVRQIRFYKGPANTGTHTGTLYDGTGNVMALGTFSDETASGWQTLTFASPVAITSGTTYTATYLTTVGRYSVTGNGLAAGRTSGPLHIPAGGAVYRYGGGFPAGTSNANYWVDVVVEPTGSN